MSDCGGNITCHISSVYYYKRRRKNPIGNSLWNCQLIMHSSDADGAVRSVIPWPYQLFCTSTIRLSLQPASPFPFPFPPSPYYPHITSNRVVIPSASPHLIMSRLKSTAASSTAHDYVLLFAVALTVRCIAASPVCAVGGTVCLSNNTCCRDAFRCVMRVSSIILTIPLCPGLAHTQVLERHYLPSQYLRQHRYLQHNLQPRATSHRLILCAAAALITIHA